jgi:hypothetical protein
MGKRSSPSIFKAVYEAAPHISIMSSVQCYRELESSDKEAFLFK